MAQRYDVETLLSTIEAFLKENLSSKLTEIRNEKDDGLSLTEIEADAYFVQALNERMKNYSPYIFIGISDPIQADSIGSATAKTYSVNVALVASDSGEDLLLWKRMLRYQRAFEELFERGWERATRGPKLKVQGYILPLPPDLRMQQAGVMLQVTID